ncbi:MAG TPA: TetR family transcriptional regulator [Trebonia sp.]|nr:TetR family transcriptional regulator [Trebonia sp.]
MPGIHPPHAPPELPTTPRGAATSRRILDAAAAEFAERGIAGARIDRIIATAHTNKAQLYGYFGSKEGLLDVVIADLPEAAGSCCATRSGARWLRERPGRRRARASRLLRPGGMTIFQANRATGWQEVFHLHVHLVPRRAGDQLRKSWVPRPATERELDEVLAGLR